MIVYLDMDGVLTDFHKGVHLVFEKPYVYSDVLQRYDFWEDWEPITTRGQVNSVCDINFWQNLEWMHDGQDIFSTIIDFCGINNIFLLTTPMPNTWSPTGKWLWVEKHIPTLKKQTIITQAPKSLLANTNALLIDDKDENVVEFRRAGGQAILVPRPWNQLHTRADKTAQEIKQQLVEVKCHEF